MTTDWTTCWRSGAHMSRERRTLMAYMDRAHELMTSSTCSRTGSFSVTVTPSTFSDVTAPACCSVQTWDFHEAPWNLPRNPQKQTDQNSCGTCGNRSLTSSKHLSMSVSDWVQYAGPSLPWWTGYTTTVILQWIGGLTYPQVSRQYPSCHSNKCLRHGDSVCTIKPFLQG